MEHLKTLLNYQILNNSLQDYFSSGCVLATLLLSIIFIRFFVIRKIKKIASSREESIIFFIRVFKKNVMPLLYYGAIYAATRNLIISQKIEKGLAVAGIVLISFFGVRILSALIIHIMENQFNKNQRSEETQKKFAGLYPAVNIILWIIGIVFLLDNLGFNISAVITGLGIGGVAVALASQAVLADLFGYFAILADKPFEIGDSITIAEFSGTIEKIGLKTTKIRSSSGELIIFSNSDLTRSRVKNYKKMTKRTISFLLNVSHENSLEKLKSIPSEIKEIVLSTGDTKFEKSVLLQIGDSLTYETSYTVFSADSKTYLEIQQNINFKILEKFNEIGIILSVSKKKKDKIL